MQLFSDSRKPGKFHVYRAARLPTWRRVGGFLIQNTFSAGMSAAGFFYQVRLALLLCMDYVNRDSGVEVAVERLDDVSFERR